MGLSDEDIEKADSVEELLQEQWHMFSTLTDPLKQTAVINMDGTHSTHPLCLYHGRLAGVYDHGTWCSIDEPGALFLVDFDRCQFASVNYRQAVLTGEDIHFVLEDPGCILISNGSYSGRVAIS